MLYILAGFFGFLLGTVATAIAAKKRIAELKGSNDRNNK